jgi:hypothetical protein
MTGLPNWRWLVVATLALLNVLAVGAMFNLATPSQFMLYQYVQQYSWYALLASPLVWLIP